MTISRTLSGEKLILSLEGRLDTTTAPELQTELIPELDKAAYVQLDFEKLAYVSSAGLRVLLMAEKTAKSRGGKMTLVNVSSEIKEIFNMAGFSEILTIE
jgi:anti-anti-sigma factor